jgi:Tfp pilus assembly protein PilX
MPELISRTVGRLRRAGRGEAGVALVVALGVMTVMALLAAGVAAVALNVKNETHHERASTRALAAAESGLRLASLRLNQALPITDGKCPGAPGTGGATPLTDPVNGQCGPYTMDLADGTSTSYYISPGKTISQALDQSLICAGAQVDTSGRPGLTTHQRCVTATGTDGSATRRAQERLLSASWIFPLPGMVGIDHINLGSGAGSTLTLGQCALSLTDVLNLGSSGTLGSGSLVAGDLGTNNLASTNLACWLYDAGDLLKGNRSQMVLGKSAPAMNGNALNPNIAGAQPGSITHLDYDLTLPPLDSIFQTGEDGIHDTSLPGGNSNATGLSLLPLLCNAGVWTASSRTLALNTGCIVTLQGSTDVDHPRIYNFCQVTYPSNGATIQLPTIATGTYARVLIDSPARPGSGCAAGTGTIGTSNGVANNGNSMLANATNAVGAQIFIYGTSDPPGQGGNLIKWQNAASVKTLLIAPKGTIQFQNRTTITGGLAAYGLDAQNGLVYVWDQNVDRVERKAIYYRSAYAECSRAPTVAGDPHSGC